MQNGVYQHGYVLLLQGLEDQLLGEVVRQERPELEEQRDRLVTSIAGGKHLRPFAQARSACLCDCSVRQPAEP